MASSLHTSSHLQGCSALIQASTRILVVCFLMLPLLQTGTVSQSLFFSLPFHTASGLASRSQHASRILSLSMSSSIKKDITKETCRQVVGLTSKQRRWCRKNYELLAAIGDGARLGLAECQRRFEKRRWSCPIAQPSIFSKILEAASKETAYVHSIQSAGITLAIARSCSRGEASTLCGCATGSELGNPEGNWTWASCSDNIADGIRFSREFLNGREDGRSPSSLMSIHDTEAGRKIVRSSMLRVCKCHGLTGTCAHRTCWYSLPKIHVVGTSLLDKYDKSIKVIPRADRRKLVPLRATSKRPKDDDLIHLQDSPDYCTSNSTVGSLGTLGRKCSPKEGAENNCDKMCCGRGYNVRRRINNEKCSCRFEWCCRVKCKRCRVAKQSFTCM
ncbi:protein Wnt-4-like [Sycon ciliatum]|uniref:protein Wnt-4-like n=1 Tax=Sycon ciliatum TaxID=27933 RepID=UPI0031F5F9EF